MGGTSTRTSPSPKFTRDEADRACLPASGAFTLINDSLWPSLNILGRTSTSVFLWPGTCDHLIKIDNMNSDFKMYHRYTYSVSARESLLSQGQWRGLFITPQWHIFGSSMKKWQLTAAGHDAVSSCPEPTKTQGHYHCTVLLPGQLRRWSVSQSVRTDGRPLSPSEIRKAPPRCYCCYLQMHREYMKGYFQFWALNKLNKLKSGILKGIS